MSQQTFFDPECAAYLSVYLNPNLYLCTSKPQQYTVHVVSVVMHLAWVIDSYITRLLA